MNVLITNISLLGNAGTEMYVKDLALELINRGHNVEVFGILLGETAQYLIQKNVHVTNKLSLLNQKPDIIHSHHNITTQKVAFYFKDIPIVYFIHDRYSTIDHPFFHKNIVKYVAVDHYCKERYIENGFQEREVDVIYNWVDTEKFHLRNIINETPKKALIFSNYMNKGEIYSDIKETCSELGIETDIVGISNGNACEKPETILNDYDIVFGKAKAGLEAMASGACFIICDVMGMGEMITSDNMEYCRRYNYGRKLMKQPITRTLLQKEIMKYDSTEIKMVSSYIRKNASLSKMADRIEVAYNSAIAQFGNNKCGIRSYSIVNHLYIIFKNFKFYTTIPLRRDYPKIFNFLNHICYYKHFKVSINNTQ